MFMITKQFALLCLFTFLSLSMCAQTAKLVSSTRQRWSGGVAGRCGANYTFVIEFSGYDQEPVPLTCWIGEEPFQIRLPDHKLGAAGNAKRIPGKKTVRYELDIRTQHSDNQQRNILRGSEKSTVKLTPPVKYKGVGLLAYRCGQKTKYFTISKILAEYPPINYP